MIPFDCQVIWSCKFLAGTTFIIICYILSFLFNLIHDYFYSGLFSLLFYNLFVLLFEQNPLSHFLSILDDVLAGELKPLRHSPDMQSEDLVWSADVKRFSHISPK